MVRFRCLAICCLLSSTAWAGEPTDLPAMGAPRSLESGGLDFSFLPKSFQSNPELEMTVDCEVTEFGHTLPAASSDHPVYYVITDSGFHPLGDGFGGDKPPSPVFLAQAMQRSLAANGFRPADARAHRPGLAIFYFWGSHYRMDLDTTALFHELARRQTEERAMLVGGRKFLNETVRRLDYGEGIFANTPKRNFLNDQMNNNLYYLVASAYDYASLTHGQRRLAWRATMTVNAQGVAIAETLPPLVLSAAPYFGRDMAEPDVVFRRVKRGTVSFGPLQIIESDVPLPAASPAKSK